MKILPMLILLALGACAPTPTETLEILVTSEAGDVMAPMPNVPFTEGRADGAVITVHPGDLRQTIHGIGSSFTESSAYVLAHLPVEKRREVMRRLFGPDGAAFTLTRTHIGSCDFSVEGKYSYMEGPESAFSIAPDSAGFEAPGIVDPDYDLLPMIREALAINPDLMIIASAWTAPPWMKDIEDWYIKGSTENNWQGQAGSLKPRHVATYADYLVKYLDAYARVGVPIWGLTPVNEPHGNGGNWESMRFTPDSQNTFIKHHLGPRLDPDVKLLVYDQNRGGLEDWVAAIYPDPETAPYVFGAAIHWYESTVNVFEDVLTRVHEAYPQFEIIHTEGCIDNLGNPAGGGITDPEGFQEDGWFLNDTFWWNETATDWAYTATWAGEGAGDHPMYTPVHRYARNIIVSLDNWVSGWVDWNVVLDRRGGPNHVGNFCGAPVMVDTETGEIHWTPVYHVLAQFSRTIRPGDRGVRTEMERGGLGEDDLHACATVGADGTLTVQVLNTTKRPIRYAVQVGGRFVEIVAPGNSVQTVRLKP